MTLDMNDYFNDPEYHFTRAKQLLRGAEDWVSVDDKTLAERGTAKATLYCDLANLHLRIREELRRWQS